MQSCSDWLRNYLRGAHGVNCNFVRRNAKVVGYTRGDLKAARLALGVLTQHACHKGKSIDAFYWYLPDEIPDNHDR